MTKLLSKFLAASFFVFCFVISSSAQSATPEAMAEQFIKAWNSHDIKSFERLFADNAVWVPVAETRLEGRDSIVRDIGAAHASWAKTTTAAQTGDTKVQKLRRDTAVVFFHFGFLDEQGKLISGIDRAFLLVVTKKSSGWRISSGQLTKQSVPQ